VSKARIPGLLQPESFMLLPKANNSEPSCTYEPILISQARFTTDFLLFA
jgi:hypothetical protein